MSTYIESRKRLTADTYIGVCHDNSDLAIASSRRAAQVRGHDGGPEAETSGPHNE